MQAVQWHAIVTYLHFFHLHFYKNFRMFRTHHKNESYGTPSEFLRSSSSHIQGYSTNPGPCELCFERQALWVGVPCGHQGFCSICKDKLRYGIQENVQCSICNDYVERWIALYWMNLLLRPFVSYEYRECTFSLSGVLSKSLGRNAFNFLCLLELALRKLSTVRFWCERGVN